VEPAGRRWTQADLAKVSYQYPLPGSRGVTPRNERAAHHPRVDLLGTSPSGSHSEIRSVHPTRHKELIGVVFRVPLVHFGLLRKLVECGKRFVVIRVAAA